MEKEKRYYIFTPAEKVSGGPELAHQMCSELLKEGRQAWMYYTAEGRKEPVDVPADARYRKYGTSHMNDMHVIEKEESVIIVSEGNAEWALLFKKCKKILWWMSVDNYTELVKMLGRDIFDELQTQVSLHLVQSEYAYSYLLKRGISPKKILRVSDYIGEDYGKFLLPADFRRNIALYNPRKGLKEIQPLIDKTGWIKWVPLINLTEEEMIARMQIAKVYVDFGNHPGKDRIPREAASCGCCVITNRKGSAGFYEDIPIPDYYKIDNVSERYDKVAEMLEDICSHWEIHTRHFDEYRKIIFYEKERFAEDVKHFIDTVERKGGFA